MQWYKHMSNMRHDVRIRRMFRKYGLKGYGLYNLILEAITENLTKESPVPNMQENCDDIAEFYGENSTEINEMANFMINQGLFDLDEISGEILCPKLYKFLEQNSTSSPLLRDTIKNYRISQTSVISSQQNVNRTEQNRTEQNIIKHKESKKLNIPPNIEEIKTYIKEKHIILDVDHFYNHYESVGWMINNRKMKNWQAAIRTWLIRSKQFKREKTTLDGVRYCHSCKAEKLHKNGKCVRCAEKARINQAAVKFTVGKLTGENNETI